VTEKKKKNTKEKMVIVRPLPDSRVKKNHEILPRRRHFGDSGEKRKKKEIKTNKQKR